MILFFFDLNEKMLDMKVFLQGIPLILRRKVVVFVHTMDGIANTINNETEVVVKLGSFTNKLNQWTLRTVAWIQIIPA